MPGPLGATVPLSPAFVAGLQASYGLRSSRQTMSLLAAGGSSPTMANYLAPSKFRQTGDSSMSAKSIFSPAWIRLEYMQSRYTGHQLLCVTPPQSSSGLLLPQRSQLLLGSLSHSLLRCTDLSHQIDRTNADVADFREDVCCHNVLLSCERCPSGEATNPNSRPDTSQLITVAGARCINFRRPRPLLRAA